MAKTIAVDWGTTNFRAYLLDEQGNLIEKIRADCGILKVTDRDFAKTLALQLARFHQDLAGVTVICCGMITSRNGWLETEYVSLPTRAEDIASQLAVISSERFGPILMVPGLCQETPHPDVIRGEESQLIGLEEKGDITVVLPGSHCKWVMVQGGVVQRFLTCMTGEIFAVASSQTILRALPAPQKNYQAFRQGVLDGFEEKGGRIFSSLFQVRARMLLSGEESGRDYLSGFFLGTEIAEALAAGFHAGGEILLIGRKDLNEAYCTALKICGLSARYVDEDVVAAGLWKIAQLCGRP